MSTYRYTSAPNISYAKTCAKSCPGKPPATQPRFFVVDDCQTVGRLLLIAVAVLAGDTAALGIMPKDNLSY